MRERSSRPGRLYAAIPNEAMRDAEISMEARGLLALLMTYSDEWTFRKDHLLDVTKWGRDKFERHMGELVSAGYVERVQTREEGTGKLLGSSWIIRDDRSPENQGVGVTEALKNRPPVKPTHGESAPIRKNNREEEQKKRTPLTPEGECDLFGVSSSEHESEPKHQAKASDRFEEFWKVYPKRVGKPAAQRNFARAVKAGADPQEIIEGARRYAESKAVADGFVKHPQGWLTDERWKDEAAEPTQPSVRRAFRPYFGEVVR